MQIGDVRIAVLRADPAVTRTPARPGAPRIVVEMEGPSWSLVGWLRARSRRTRRFLLGALAAAAVVLVALAVVLATRRTEDELIADAIRAGAPATLQIETRSGGVRSGLGSGWTLDSDGGLVVTAAHVLNTGQLYYADDRVASVAGVAPCEDLAVLRVAGGLGGPELAFGGAGRGDPVVALGFPATVEAGDLAAPARGVVAADDALVPDATPEVPIVPHTLQSDLVLDPGFSGGPLVDLDGKVAGVDVAVRGRRAFAVSADRAAAVVEQLSVGRSAGWMGAQLGFPVPIDVSRLDYPPGLWITGVLPGSGAARAGVQEGDYIVRVDGRPVGTTLAGWCAAAGDVRSGQVARVELIRVTDSSRATVPVRFD